MQWSFPALSAIQGPVEPLAQTESPECQARLVNPVIKPQSFRYQDCLGLPV